MEYGAFDDSEPPTFQNVPVVVSNKGEGRSKGKWIAAATVILGAIGVISTMKNSQFTKGDLAFDSTDDVPAIIVSNAYERAKGHKVGDGIFWQHFAQRYRDTRIETTSTNDCAADNFGQRWDIIRPDSTYGGTFYGSPVEVMFADHGHHTVKLTETCGDTTTSYEYDVMSKHVRYEIRSLSNEDRNAFFNALHAVYNTNQKDGVAKYGAKFRSIEYLVREHLYGAASKDCDHWHDDAGILTHHMAFTLELEQGLQTIQPNITIPYWDYTIDSYSVSDFVNSPIFYDSWFGAASPDNDEHIITKGRWAYQSVLKNAQDYSHVHNPYGVLRSPWNTNPIGFITRSRYTLGVKDGGWTIPACMDFNEVSNFDWIGDYFSALNGELHGPIHIMIGGHWFYDDHSYNISKGLAATSSGSQLSDGFLLASKFLWRQGYIRCPDFCSADTSTTDCSCSIPSEIQGDKDAYTILESTGIFNSIGTFEQPAFLNAMGTTYQGLLDFLGHVGHPGEMFTSAAPYDPTFWPLHGVAERFMGMARIASYEFDIIDLNETWGYRHSDVMSDTHVVCDWDGLTGTEMPDCVKGVTCSGHKSDDLLPMGDFLGSGETYTNMEFYEFSAPWNDDLPYTYDTFFDWPACSEQGIDFFTSYSSYNSLYTDIVARNPLKSKTVSMDTESSPSKLSGMSGIF